MQHGEPASRVFHLPALAAGRSSKRSSLAPAPTS